MFNVLAWAAAILLYGFGDGLLTYLGTRYENIEEGMTVTRRLLGANPSLRGLALLKIGSLGVFYIAYLLMKENQYRDLVPVGLAVLGVYAVTMNSYAIILERRSIQ